MTRGRLARSLILTASIAVLAVFGVVPAPSAGRTTGARLRRAPDRGAATAQDLPANVQSSIFHVLGGTEHRFYARRVAGGEVAMGGGLSGRFTSRGAQLRVAGGDLTLGAVAVGRGAEIGPSGDGSVSTRRNVIAYHLGSGLTESYLAGPLGFEQRFVLEHRPAGSARRPVSLTVRIAGGLTPHLLRRGILVYTSSGGRSVLREGGLLVTDARGHRLRAWFSLSGRHLIRIEVEDRRAAYPLRVDPTLSVEKVLTASDGASGAEFGYSVAASPTGSLFAVGAPNETVDGVASEGAVYVFSGAGQELAKLTLAPSTTNQENFELGMAVAISGSTVVAGASAESDPHPIYLFNEPSGGWSSEHPTGQLTATNGTPVPLLAASGNTVVVAVQICCSLHDDVDVYTEPPGGWTSDSQTAVLTTTDGDTNDGLSSVAISGPTVAAGDQSWNDGQGDVYVFSKGGTTWHSEDPTAQLTALVGPFGSSSGGDEFLGYSVAISGTTVVAGINQVGGAVLFTDATSGGSSGTWLDPGPTFTYGRSNVAITDTDAFVTDQYNGSTLYEYALSSGSTESPAATGPVPGNATIAAWPSGEIVGQPFATDAGEASLVSAAGSSTTPPPPTYKPPAVSLSGASNVGDTSATLSGTVNPEASKVTSCEFQYGEDTGYGSTAPCSPSPGAGNRAVQVSATLSGLTPGTTYYYRLQATNPYGTTDTSGSSFVTSGSSAPSVLTTGADWNYNNPVATLGGTVNPHNLPTTYSFYWGTSSHDITSASQLGEYGHETTVQSAGSGTTYEGASAQISVSNEVTYYFRIVATNSLGTTVGGESSFEVLAPEPTNTSPPYLQDSGGFDPEQGFELRCVPGSWQNTNGHYSIQWVYVQPDGSISPALGQTRSTNHPNDVYEVTNEDVNQLVGCLVNAQSLDGYFYGSGLEEWPYGTAELSNQVLVADPAVTAFPAWFKAAYSVLSTELTGVSIYSAAMDCAEFADVPGFGEGICIVAAGSVLAQYLFGQELSVSSDPPDPQYSSLARVSRSLPVKTSGVCTHRLSRRACRRLRGLARSYGILAARTAALVDTLNVTRNRFMVAKRKHNHNAMYAQAAAGKVYAGMVQTALAAEHRAALRYARALQKDRIDPRTSVAALRRVADESPSRLVKSRVFRALMRHGASRASIIAALRFERKHARLRAFNLIRFLTAPPPRMPLARVYDTMNFDDLEALVATLGTQHAASRSTVTRLYRAINTARAACTRRSRAADVRALTRDDRRLALGYRQLLAAAIAPIAGGHDRSDPYGRCSVRRAAPKPR